MTPETKAVKVRCSGCQAILKIKSEAVGRVIACPKCGKKMKLAPPSKPTGTSAPPAISPDFSSEFSQDPFSNPPSLPKTVSQAAYTAPRGGQGAYPPTKLSAARPKKRSSGINSSTVLIWVGIGAAASVLLIVGTMAISILSSVRSSADSTLAAGANQPSSDPAAGNSNANSSRESVDFPPLAQFMNFGNSNIVWQRVFIARPGKPRLKLNIFMPKGSHADKSLPVVFEAPAGTPLLHGADIGYPTPATEFLPFTEAGMITVSFDIDGSMPSNMGPDAGAIYMQFLGKAYREFTAADAGVDNGKMAIDFVLSRLPAADPNQLFVWGHSSAATLSLLLASKDSRIAKCIALAPITDLTPRLGELLQMPEMSASLPNFSSYLKTGSPTNYVRQLKCPVFIAHAKNDDNAPFSETASYVSQLRGAGAKVNFLELTREGHYQPLLDAAIPKALEWLQ